MRISTNTTQQQSINTMLERQSEVYKTQQQLSTGKRILAPSDDPQGAARAMGLSRELERVSQYELSGNMADSHLVGEEGVLQGATDILQAAHELAVRGLNGTMSADDRAVMAKEARQFIDEMLNLANTRGASGEYLFSGYQGDIRPFDFDSATGATTYNGDSGQRQIKISDHLSVAQNDSGDAVFVNVPGGTDIFQALNSFAEGLENNSVNGAMLDDIGSALSHVLDVRGSLGARLTTIERQQESNADYKLYTQQILSSIEDVDYAEGITRLNAQMLNLQAIQQSYTKVQGLSLFNYM